MTLESEKKNFLDLTAKYGKDSVLFGKHSIFTAITAKKRRIYKIYISRDEYIPFLQKNNINFLKLNNKFFEDVLNKEATHQGIMGVFSPLPEIRFDEHLEYLASKEFSVIIVLDQISDPHNVGAIIRSAAAFGADAVITPKDNAAISGSTIAKTSSGAIETVPFIKVTNLVSTLNDLKRIGYWCIGLDGYANDTFGLKHLSKKTVFIMGSEDKGMRRLTKENCDNILKFPISGVESLNVSNAAAIALYEYSKLINS